MILINIRNMLVGECVEERLVYVVENLQCCVFVKCGVMICVLGIFVVGIYFVLIGLQWLFLCLLFIFCFLEIFIYLGK